MKTRNIILYLIGLLALTSCDDMFAPADENNRQEDAMYEESKYAHGLLMYAYARLPYMTTSQTDIATDDAVTNLKSSNMITMAQGAWASDNNPMSQWNACKDGVQYVNLFLTKVDKVKWALSAASKQQMFIDRLKGEALGLRAIFYYHLLQAHGGYADDDVLYGVPLLTAPEDPKSNFNQSRATFAACIKQIFEDCDKAAQLLPTEYKDIDDMSVIPADYKELGAEISGYNLVFGSKAKNLVSRKVVLAVKAQAALLAASPAFREQSGVTSAQAAEICAQALETVGGLEGFDNSGNVWYKLKNKLDPSATAEMAEIIWREDRHNNNDLEKENFPPSLYGNGRINPSQNLVDAFPAANGYPISDRERSGYKDQDPYSNRDPRLANTVVYNGMTFKTDPIRTGVDMPYGTNGKTDDNLNSIEKSTRTGYYLKKLLREDVSVNPSGQLTQYHIYPRIRLTEIFLAYAEAANDAWGPDGKAPGVNYSAYDVIKKIRSRAGVGISEPGIPFDETDPYLLECKSDKAKMTDLIRNERRLELCFENKRFWDLRRWLLPLNETVRGMRVETDPNKDDGSLLYTVIPDVEVRNFDSSYQCYGPIPHDQDIQWSNLKQNKGWK